MWARLLIGFGVVSAAAGMPPALAHADAGIGSRTAVVSAAAEPTPDHGAVEGRIVDELGVGLPDFIVRMADGDGRPAGFTKTDDDGGFRLTDLPVGEYVLVANPDERVWGPVVKVTAEAAVDVVAASSTAIDVEVTVLTGAEDFAEMAASRSTSTDAPTAAAGSGSIGGAVTGAGVGALIDVDVIACPLTGGVCSSTLTAGDGTYQIDGLDTEEHRIQFVPPAGSPFVSEYYDDASFAFATPVLVADGVVTGGIDAELALAGSIAGTVTGSGAGALADVEVIACPLTVGSCSSALTAADGSYQIDGLPAQGHRVRFVPPSGSPFVSEYYIDATYSSASAVAVVSGATTSGIDAELELAGSIAGTVTGAGLGALDDAEVIACPLPVGSCTSVPTAVDGTYQIDGLRAADYVVQFFPPVGLLLVGEYYNDATSYVSASPVTVSAGATTGGIDAELAAPGSIAGTVTGESTGGLSGVSVWACGVSTGGCNFSSTAVDGTYQIDDLLPDDYRVEFTPPYGSTFIAEYYDDTLDYSSATLVPVVAETVTAAIDAELALGGLIEGTVTGAGGAGVLANVDVTACPFGSGSCRYAFTAADGTYQIDGLTPGDHWVEFSPSYGSGFLTEYYNDAADFGSATHVAVSGGVATAGIDAELAQSGSIAGTVTGAGGAGGLADVYVQACSVVTAQCLGAYTAADGTYQVDGLMPGDHTVEFTPQFGDYLGEFYDDAGDASSATLVAVIGGAVTSPVDAELAVGGSISGTVTGAGGAGGLLDVYVEACSIATAECRGDSTAADGSYQIGGLASGDHTVEFSPLPASGFLGEFYNDAVDAASATSVAVTVGVLTSAIDAELAAGGSLAGTVTGAGGAGGLANVDVAVCPVGSTACSAGVTAVDGTYQVDQLAPGDFTVEFTPQPGSGYVAEFYDDAGDVSSATPVSITAGAVASPIDAELAQRGSIAGTVTGAGGAGGLADVDVTVCPVGGSGCSTVLTAVDGTYLVADLVPGDFTVEFQPQFGSGYVAEFYDDTTNFLLAAPVPVPSGGVTAGIDAELALRGSIVGTVTDDVGAGGLEGIEVHACPTASGGCVVTQTASDGVYQIADLEPGFYRVRFSASDQSHVGEYYDDTTSFSSATLVSVNTGEVTSGIDAALTLAGSIAGTVTGAGGGGALGAVSVRACPLGSGSCVYASTAVDGSYEFDGLAPGDYQVRFELSSSSYAVEYYLDAPDSSSATPVAVTGGAVTGGIDAELDLGGSITGVVTGEGGVGGLASAYVQACPINSGSCRSSSTASDGSYSIDGLIGGDYRVRFSSTSYVTEYYLDTIDYAAAIPVAVTAGLVTPGIDAELEAGGSIAGLVTGAAGAGGLSSVQIRACAMGPGSCEYTSTAADGSYLIAGLAPGDYEVYFWPYSGAGYLPEYYDDEVDFPAATAVPVAAGAVTSGIDAVLVLGGSISGTVTGAGGAGGIVNVAVNACSVATGLCEYTTTANDGKYQIDGLHPGSHRLEFSPPSASPYLGEFYDDVPTSAMATSVLVASSVVTSGIDAELAVGGSITGTVTDAGGAGGLVDISVTACPFSGSGPCGYGVTAADGTYELVGLWAGDHWVEFSPPGGSPYQSEYYDDQSDYFSATPVSVALNIETPNIDADLVVGGSISGTVTDAAGPLAGVLVGACVYGDSFCGTGNFISSRAATTAADGTYSVEGLPAGFYTVTFWPPFGSSYVTEYYDDITDYFSATALSVSLGVAEVGIDAELTLGGSIAGVVTGGGGGGPQVDALVQACPTGSGYCSSAWTAADGSYQIDALAPGPYRVDFSPPSGSPYLSEYYDGTADYSSATLVDVVSGVVSTGIDAELELGGSIAGTVTGSGGALADVSVLACPTAGGSCQSSTTAVDGTYQVDGLVAGDHEVQFSPPSGSPYVGEYYDAADYWSAIPVPVVSGAVTPGIDADLALGGSIAGTVTGAGVGNLAGATVGVCPAGDSWCAFGYYGYDYVTTSAADGTYQVDGLPAGSYTVTFVGPYGSAYVTEFYDDTTDYYSATQIGVTLATVTPGIDAELVVPGSIAGAVTGAGGAGGLSGVGVQVCPVAGGSCGYSTTAPDGAYQVDLLAPGDFTVQFTAPSGSPFVSEYFDDAADSSSATAVTVASGVVTASIDAELALGGSIAGTVTGEGGVGGLAGAGVTACLVVGGLCRDATTAGDGTYEIVGLIAGDYRVSFSPPTGYLFEYYDDAADYGTAAPVAVVLGAVTPGINAELALAGSVAGTVTRSDGGTGLADVSVTVCSVSGGSCGYATTLPDGSYLVEGLTPGDVTVRFDPWYGAPYRGEFYDDVTEALLATPVGVVGGVTTPGIDAEVARLGSIAGTVSGPGAVGPLAGVQVYAQLDEGYGSGYATTAADGTYLIDGLSPGNYVVAFSASSTPYADEIYDDAPGYWSPTLVPVTLGTVTSSVDAELSSGGSISGAVTVEGTGAGLVGAQVQVCGGGSSACRNGSTAPGGAYLIDGLAPGVYEVNFSAPGYVDEFYDDADDSSATPVTVTLGATTAGIDAALAAVPSPGSITGLVTGGGVGLQGVFVEACLIDSSYWSCEYATTMADGAFVVTGLAPGDYRVYFAPPSGLSYLGEFYADTADYLAATPVAVSTGTTTPGVDAALDLAGSISGMVADDDGGVPLANVSVEACTPTHQVCGYASTAADGTYTIDGLPPGDYDVRFRTFDGLYAPEYYDDVFTVAAATPVGVLPGADTPNIDASLGTPGSISGTVTGADTAAPLPYLFVIVCAVDEPWNCRYDDTAIDGSYQVDGLAPGDHTVFFETDSQSAYYPYSAEYYDGQADEASATPVPVVAGATTTGIDAALAPFGSITGTVTGEGLGPLRNVDVRACPVGTGFCRGGSTSADGTYEIPDLPAGDYIVEFTSPTGSPFVTEFYDDAADEPVADLVTVLAGVPTAGIDAELADSTVPPIDSWPDFDGDGSADRSVWRPSFGGWFVLGQATQFLGLSTDVPVPADYDGDGDTERAVFRNGVWYIEGQATKFLGAAGDIPVPGDYDGDGTDEVAVYRNGAWIVEGEATVYLGLPTDVAVPADYDGDGTTERAVYRPSIGAWYVEGAAPVYFGRSTDVPVPADYDGDGSVERAVYRPSYGGWFVEGEATQFLGLSTDVVVPADYDGDGSVERAVYRPAYGAWFVQGAATQFYGRSTDVPVPIPAAVYGEYY